MKPAWIHKITRIYPDEPAAKAERSRSTFENWFFCLPAARHEAMITRIEIDGFKSFSQFAIDLKPLHVLIGPNGGGKSNLFEALHFLSTLVTRDVQAATEVPVRGGLSDLFRKTPDGPVHEIRFAVEMAVQIPSDPDGAEGHQLHERKERLRYEIVLRRREGRRALEVTSEVAALSFPINDVPESKRALVEPPGEAIHKAMHGEGLASSDIPKGFQTAYDLRKSGVASSRTYLSTFLEAGVDDEQNVSVFGRLYRALSRVHVAPFSADALRRATNPPTLLESSSYFYSIAEAIAKIQEPPAFRLREVRQALLDLIPDVNELHVQHDEYENRHRVYIEWVDGMKTALPQLSDGTLRALALVTMAHDRRHDGMVMIEEPENGVHPGRLKQLTRYYRMLANPRGRKRARQCMISTHSPILLKYLLRGMNEEPSDAVVYTETPGITLITTALRSDEGRVSIGLNVDPTMTYADRTRDRAGEVHAHSQLIKYLEEGDLHALVNDIKSSFEPEVA